MRHEDSVDARADARTGGSRRPTTSRRCSGSTRAAAPTEISTQASGSALERLLVSPDFLFRIEADPAFAKAQGAPYRLSDVELASRLSFFLWSSIPDDELLDLAIRGKLRDAKVLDRRCGACWPIRARVGTGAELLQSVAADAQRLAADAGREPAAIRGSTTTSARRS